MEKYYKKLNQENSSYINRLIVFNLIKSKKSIKRNEISKETGLRASTISYIIRDLKKANLIIETEIAEKRILVKGVKPFIVNIDNEKNYLIGIEIKENEFHIVGIRLDDSILFKETFEVKSDLTITDNIINIIEQTKSNYSSKRLLGVGIGIPGVINPQNNEIIISNVLDLKNFRIDGNFIKKIGVPVYLENNANSASYGEYISFYKNKHNYLIFIYFQFKGTGKFNKVGIGSGIIIGGEIYHGELYAAGEIGDIIFNSIKENTMEFENLDLNSNFYEILKKSENSNEKEILNIVYNLGHHIGESISDIINVLNPGIVVIGGDDNSIYGKFFEGIKRGIEEHIVSFYRDKISIVQSNLKEDAVAFGAATIASKNIFSINYFQKLLKEKEENYYEKV